MELPYLFLFIFALLGFVPTQVLGQQGTGPSLKLCWNVTVPVTVTSTNLIYGLPHFEGQLDVTALNTNLNTRGFLNTLVPFVGTQNQTASYHIAGTYCKANVQDPKTLLIATHGLTLDRYYWDLQYQPKNYSFVDFVVNKGFSVFYYDRIGSGQSSTIDGYNAQYSIQAAALEQIIDYIRSGSMLLFGSKVAPKKIVLVGHSMGAAISDMVLANNPTAADGAILTGWSRDSGVLGAAIPGLYSATIGLKQANILSQSRFGAYNSGWLTFTDVYGYIQLFNKNGFFDFALAQYSLARSWPIAIMEMFTITAENYVSQTTVPVLFQVGVSDYIMCQGDCSGVFSVDIVKNLFPQSVGLEAVMQPNTGHCLTSHYNATGGYKVITDYLGRHGF